MFPDLLLFALIGFLAQMVDGALGMAYGVTSATFLLHLGVPPAIASATVHTAELFTTSASGLSHLFFRNIDWRVFKRLLLPGVLGAILGAGLLSHVPVQPFRYLVALYLLVMGIVILRKALKMTQPTGSPVTRLFPLGFCGGFFDALGGGGWGPIVVASLLGRGGVPRYTVGTVNLVEFFVALAASATFFLTIGFDYWPRIVGMVLGGVLAAPLAAYVCKKIPARPFMVLVGILILILNLHTLLQLFFWG